MLAETDSSGNTVNEYIYFDGMRIARRDAGGNVYYSFPNELGSPTVTTAAGSTCHDADFYPFGGEHAYTSTCAPNQKFAGMEQDSATGLYRTTFRQYAPSNGRWLSPDPYAGSYDLTNPQTMNRYAYVGNMPMNYTDPFGLDTITVGGAVDCSGALSFEGGGWQLPNCDPVNGPFNVSTSWSTPLSNGPSFEDSYDNGMIGFSGSLGGFGELGGGHPSGGGGGGGGGGGAPSNPKPTPKICYGTFAFGGVEGDAGFGGVFSGEIVEVDNANGVSGGHLGEAWGEGEVLAAGAGKITAPTDTSPLQGLFGFVGLGISAGPLAGFQLGYAGAGSRGGFYLEAHAGPLAGGAGIYLRSCKAGG